MEKVDRVMSVAPTHLPGTQPQEYQRRPDPLWSFSIGHRGSQKVMERVAETTGELVGWFMELAHPGSCGWEAILLYRGKLRYLIPHPLLSDCGQPGPEVNPILAIDVVCRDMKLQVHPLLKAR